MDKEEEEAMSSWRRKCGCIRTSEKLKQILKRFPTPPPPSPENTTPTGTFENTCISAYCAHMHQPSIFATDVSAESKDVSTEVGTKKHITTNKSWQLIGELVQLIQLSVTATALALYYLIYCYMQLVYYTLRSALYFHHADGPMKITIGVVTLTSLVVGFNLVLRMEKLIGLFF